MVSNFDEKSGIIAFETPWGRWHQTVDEVTIEINVEPGTRGKDVQVITQPNHISCTVKGKKIFKARPFDTVCEDESTWTIEDRQLVRIQLIKARRKCRDFCWLSLGTDLDASGFQVAQPDPETLSEMRKKLDLEQFQKENPGFDFSNAKLDKRYEQRSVKRMADAIDP